MRLGLGEMTVDESMLNNIISQEKSSAALNTSGVEISQKKKIEEDDTRSSPADVYTNLPDLLNGLSNQQTCGHAKMMLDSAPFGVLLWDENINIIEANQAVLTFYGVKDEYDLQARIFDRIPEIQPNGSRSDEQVRRYVSKAFAEGRCVFEWTYQSLDGTPVPSEITLIRVSDGTRHFVVGYINDLRECKRMMYDLEHKNLLLHTANQIASVLLQSQNEKLEANILLSMSMLAEVVNVDRVYIWKNYRKSGKLYCSQQYEWSLRVPSQHHIALVKEFAQETLYSDWIPRWEEQLSQGHCINNIVREMPETERAGLMPQGVMSILVVPIFIGNEFWGFVGFDDCRHERLFSENDEIILRAASELFAGALSHAMLDQEKDKVNYDPMTGMYNRRYFDGTIQRLIQTCSRSDSPLTLMMIDVDHFKRYNDLYGHVAGDACLKAIAEVLQTSITRADDFAARYGGEEFVVVLPNTDEAGACMMAKKLLDKICKQGIIHERNPPMNCVTISIGITTGTVSHTCGAYDFVRRADEMLYVSKQNGRNQYTFGRME